MKNLIKKFLTAAWMTTGFIIICSTPMMAADAALITKEELKSMMDKETVSILDVRQGRDWSSSEFKIKGAKRVEPWKYKDSLETYPKSQTLVLYCA